MPRQESISLYSANGDGCFRWRDLEVKRFAVAKPSKLHHCYVLSLKPLGYVFGYLTGVDDRR